MAANASAASDAINAMHLNTLNLIATIGAFVLALGILISIVNAYIGIRGGTPAGHDPWGGETLEWFTTSPPPPHNFDTVPYVTSARPLYDLRRRLKERGEL